MSDISSSGRAPSEPAVQVDGAVVWFGTQNALNGASLRIEPGEFVALVGPSGSGKSTLLDVIAGLTRPAAGNVMVGGIAPWQLTDDARSGFRRDSIARVPQHGELLDELSVLDNIALPLILAGRGRTAAQAAAKTECERLAISDIERPPTALSGGQRQLVAMARALASKASILLADEPTGALDTVAGQELMRRLTAERASRELTLLLVTHEPRVAAHADREVVLRDGSTTAVDR